MSLLLFPPPPPANPIFGARHYRIATLGIFFLAFYGSLIPLDWKPVPLGEALSRLMSPALIDPGNTRARGDWVVTVVMYGTLGFLLIGTLAVDRPARRAWEVAFLCFAACSLFGVLIEFLQCFFPPRTVSLNDLVVQAVGSLLGVAAWLLGGQRFTEWLRRLWAVRGLKGLARLVLPGYVAVLLVVQLMPFDFVVGFDELVEKLQNGRDVVLLPFARATQGIVPYTIKLLTTSLAFGLLGFLSTLAFPRWAYSSSGRWQGLLILITPLAIEILQFFVYSRSCDVTDVIVGTAVVFVGGLLGARAETLVQETRTRLLGNAQLLTLSCGAALLLWFGLLLLVEWYPLGALTTDPRAFQQETEELPELGMRRMSWAPLVDYYWNDKYNALDQFAKKSLAFAPLGLILAFWPLRRHGPGVAGGVACAAFLIATMVEAGQYFHPTHHPSITDLLLGVMGATMSYALTRHVQAALHIGAPTMGQLA